MYLLPSDMRTIQKKCEVMIITMHIMYIDQKHPFCIVCRRVTFEQKCIAKNSDTVQVAKGLVFH